MSELHLIYTLVGINIFQFFFWGYHVHVLVNKLMSKNFAEYDLITKGPPAKKEPEVDIEALNEEQSILNELNGQLRGA